MTLGEYDYATFNDTPYPGMAKIIFVIFQIFIPILLFNMLIAMMGNTYASVNEKSEKEFLKMWAKIIMSFERSVPQNQAKEYLEKYSIRLTATERGVMVIKAKDKTRASQRKGALSNWKVHFIFFINYRTRVIITRGLYTFCPILEDHFFVFKEVSIQERLLIKSVRYNDFKHKIGCFTSSTKVWKL